MGSPRSHPRSSQRSPASFWERSRYGGDGPASPTSARRFCRDDPTFTGIDRVTLRRPGDGSREPGGAVPNPRLTAQEAEGLRGHELGLGDLRVHRSLTQAQLAQAIGTTQSAISRLERQPDLLVSTLGEYITGTGGRLRLTADYGTYEVDLDLAALRTEPVEAEREFRVVWQNVQTRQLAHVGWLHVGAGRYAFEYT